MTGKVGALLLLALLAAACGPGGGEEPPTYWTVPDFTLVNQAADTVRAAHLDGAPWVASFVFTSCQGVCPGITARMASLRDTLAARGLLGSRVRLVSVSVDPARDTAAALRAYAERFGGAEPGRWDFLTGSPPERVRDLVQRGFHLTATLPDSAADGESYQVNHSPRVLLVDARRRVRGAYDATLPASFDSLRADLEVLLE